MKTFKEYINNRPVLNTTETVVIDGIGSMLAKVDSGNEAYNVLHGVNLKIDNNEVTFTTIDNKQVTRPLKGSINIHIGSGVKEDRPLVELSIKLKNVPYEKVPFSIADRSENNEPILIGEPFLKEINAVIDVNG